MVHLHLNNSRDFGEEIMEGFVPLLSLVQLDVGNEKAGGERAVYRDGSPFFPRGRQKVTDKNS